MRIVLAHPGQQHSFKVAHALKEKGHLLKFFTGLYFNPDSFFVRSIYHCLSTEDKQRFEKRRDPLLDKDVITCYSFLSLAVIALSRFHRTKKISYILDRKISDWFGKRVAKYAIKNQADAVICFSMNEVKCFEYLQRNAPSILRIVDCANAPVAFMKSIYENDRFRDELRKEVPSFWDKKELEKQQYGLSLTQCFLTPSSFVKKGLVFCGVEPSSVRILPYGSNFPAERKLASEDDSSPIRFVYVGQVTYRKGIPYLLAAFTQLNRENVQLDIVGGWEHDSSLYYNYKDTPGITFHGHINHDDVAAVLKNSNVFVFASLSDSFSLSTLEAMSFSLPIICSTNNGSSDLIKEGENGFTFEYQDVDRLKALMLLFVENRKLVQVMGRSAYETARTYTWAHYADGLDDIISHLA